MCCLSGLLLPFVFGAKAPQKPLTLQWEVSHSRNTDQISLIFRTNKVELITNTSAYQKGLTRLGSWSSIKILRLGRFQTGLSPELKIIKNQVEQYYTNLKTTVPVADLIKDPRFKSSPDPHAPILRINEETVPAGHSYFKALKAIIHKVYEHKWTCLECAEYRKKTPVSKKPFTLQDFHNILKRSKTSTVGNKKPPGKKPQRAVQIIREVKTLKPDLKKAKEAQPPAKPAHQVKKKVFSQKQLNCISKGQNKIECVDPQFGIFEL